MCLFNLDTLFGLCIIVFDACIEKWGITNEQMSCLILDHSLVTFIEDNEMYFNGMGIKGIIEEVEEYIVSQGGFVCQLQR